MQENRNITVPKNLESTMDIVLTEMKITNTKKDLISSSYWKEAVETLAESENKKEPQFVMYTVKINETLAFQVGMKVNARK